MKKSLLTVFVALGISLNASAQAFFEAVTFTGAFAPYGTSYTAKIEGGFTGPTGILKKLFIQALLMKLYQVILLLTKQ